MEFEAGPAVRANTYYGFKIPNGMGLPKVIGNNFVEHLLGYSFGSVLAELGPLTLVPRRFGPRTTWAVESVGLVHGKK